MVQKTCALFLVLAGCAAQSAQTPATPPAAAETNPVLPVVHTVTGSEQGLSVNAYLIESASGVVVVDSALTVSDGRALRARVDALGKPLIAVLLTHGHPDHYNGVAPLTAGRDIPVYATASVAAIIRRDDAAKNTQWQPVFGPEWPSDRAFPNRELADHAHVSLAGLELVVHDVGPGESYADSYWELLGPLHVAFIGDTFLYQHHAYTNDGHSKDWLAHLAQMKQDLSGVARLYPGHGAAGDLSLLDWDPTRRTPRRTPRESVRALGAAGRPIRYATAHRRWQCE